MLRPVIIAPTYDEANNVATLIAAIAEASKLNDDTDNTPVVLDESSADGTPLTNLTLVPIHKLRRG